VEPDGAAADPGRLRVAFVGKGGAGKSVIAGTFVRLLAARGEPVLAVDSDPMPGLALSMGVDASDAGIPEDAVEENPDEEGWRWKLRLPAEEALGRYAVPGPDGALFLQFGKLHGVINGQMVKSQLAFRQIVDGLPADRWHVVGDLPGGTRQPFFGWGRFASTILVVCEPTAKGLLSGRRLARLAEAKEGPRVVAVVSKAREPDDAELVARRTGLEVVASIPWDEAVADGERRGRAPVDHAPDAPAVRAVADLLERLYDKEIAP
jgi:CO dehydrogenase maturation factor